MDGMTFTQDDVGRLVQVHQGTRCWLDWDLGTAVVPPGPLICTITRVDEQLRLLSIRAAELGEVLVPWDEAQRPRAVAIREASAWHGAEPTQSRFGSTMRVKKGEEVRLLAQNGDLRQVANPTLGVVWIPAKCLRILHPFGPPSPSGPPGPLPRTSTQLRFPALGCCGALILRGILLLLGAGLMIDAFASDSADDIRLDNEWEFIAGLILFIACGGLWLIQIDS